jgi:hypothetical protein
MGKQLLKMWKLDQDSLSKWREITNLSAANRFLQGASKQDIIWKNSKEVKKLRASISFVTICVLPEYVHHYLPIELFSL